MTADDILKMMHDWPDDVPCDYVPWAVEEIDRLRVESAWLKRQLDHIGRISALATIGDAAGDGDISDLRAENAKLLENLQQLYDGMSNSALEAYVSQEQVKKLQAALKPFADAAEDLDEDAKDSWRIGEHWAAGNLTIGSLRAASAAIRETE